MPPKIPVNERLEDHERRITTLEAVANDISDISATVTKIARHIRIWGPAIIGAAISAGIVNGKLGAFFNALLTGG